MKIEISTKNLELNPSLTSYIEEKMGAITKHIQKFEMEGDLHLKVQIGRITDHHKKGEVYEATADLLVPGENLRAENTNEDMRAAIDTVKDIIIREVEKYKTKISS